LIDELLFSLEWDWNDDGLDFGNSWGKDKTFVVAVLHHHDTDRSGGEAPTCLPNQFLFLLFVFEFNTKHLGEVLAQIVAGSSLNGTSILINPSFNS
jgi:hypothetical protein